MLKRGAMARVAPALPISPKLFRHFAVVTLVITCCIAMFADGEGREAMAAQIDERKKQNDLLVAQAKTVGQRSIGLGKIKTEKGVVALANANLNETESDSAFGAPMDTPGGSSSDIEEAPSSSSPPGPLGRIGQVTGANPVSVIPPHARQQAPRSAQPKRPSQAQLQNMIAASQRRSGAAD